MIVSWPGMIKAGQNSGAPVDHVDLLASFAALPVGDRPLRRTADSLDVLPARLGRSPTGGGS